MSEDQVFAETAEENASDNNEDEMPLETKAKKHKKRKKHKSDKKKKKKHKRSESERCSEEDHNQAEVANGTETAENDAPMIKKGRRRKAAKLSTQHTKKKRADKQPDSCNICQQTFGENSKEPCPHRQATSRDGLSNCGSDDAEQDIPQDPLDMENSTEGEFQFEFNTRFNTNVDFDVQYAIVTKMFKGKIVTEICKEYNLPQDIVHEIWEKRENLLDMSASGRLDKESFRELDAKLIEWYNNRKANNDPVTGKMMIEKAEEFAHECGQLSFISNSKWIDRFKKRHNIALRSVPRKREPYIGPFGKKVKESFLAEIWPEIRVGFTDEDIFTADEIGVFYNPSSGRILRKMGKKYIHGQPKDRLAIFMCTNLTGNEKKKLLVCGVDDPLKGTTRSADTLPVRYIRNNYGHFTTATFEDEIRKWDTQLEKDNRRALLILDRASIHTKMMTLNLKLVFVPWKASTVLMPIKNGISAAFREEFRKLILLSKVQNVMRGIDRRLTCLEGLELLGKAWSRVSSEVIMKSFAAAGYDAINKYPKMDYQVVPPLYTLSDQMLMCKWLGDYDVDSYFMDLTKLESYLTVDEEVLTDSGTHSSVFGGNRKAKEVVFTDRPPEEENMAIGTEKPTDGGKESLMMKIRASQDLEIVRQYLESTDTSYEVFNAFAETEKFLVRNPLRINMVNVDLIIKQEN